MQNKIYVASVWWRDCDVLYSVAGWDKQEVEQRTNELMDDTLRDAQENDESIGPELGPTINASDLCWSGVNAFNWPNDSLGIPKENIAELDRDGITVY